LSKRLFFAEDRRRVHPPSACIVSDLFSRHLPLEVLLLDV